MTENVNKVLGCLIEKRLVDMQSGAINHGWLAAKDIAARCGFEKIGTAVGCVVALMNKGLLSQMKTRRLTVESTSITESKTTPILLSLILSTASLSPRKK